MVPRCARTGQVVEPMLTDQWFVAMSKVSDKDPTGKSIAQKAIDAVESRRGELRARELGQHLQPVDEQHPGLVHLAPAVVGPPDPGLVRRGRQRLRGAQARRRRRPRRRARRCTRDPDVLDTWYSSALVPFSTLGWPAKTQGHGPVPALVGAGHRLRHHLLLGRPDDHDDHALHRPGAVPPRVHPRPGARFARQEDEQVRRATCSIRST